MRLTSTILGLAATAVTMTMSTAAKPKPTVPSEYLQINHKAGDAPPSGYVDKNQTVYLSGMKDAVDEMLPRNCSTVMIGSAVPGGDKESGWEEIPEVAGFDLERIAVRKNKINAAQTYYIENTKNFKKVERVVIVNAGIMRNGWKYANNMRNSLLCASGREEVHADWNKTLIVSLQWLNQHDKRAGAGRKSDVHFYNNTYQRGRESTGPKDLNISSYEILDQLIDTFWDKDVYPKVNDLVFIGHSLGGQTVQRYAILRPSQPEDKNITFGIMNPGSYAWLTPSRPARDNDCRDRKDYDSWPYGIGSGQPMNFPDYVRDEALGNRSALVDRFLSRNIFYGYALNDHIQGDTHCPANWQGSNHLTKGMNFIKMLEGLAGGMPKAQSVNYVEGVGHDNWRMFLDATLQRRMFVE